MTDPTKKLRTLIVITLLAAILPVFFYLCSFKQCLISKDPNEWGAFGSYLSGTSGLVFSFFAVLFSLISILVSVNISKKIQEDSKQLIITQNRPYPYINLIKFKDKTSVELQNMGLGPMIVNNIRITKGKKEYPHFKELTHKIIESLGIQNIGEYISIIYNTAPDYVIPSEGSKSLLLIEVKKEANLIRYDEMVELNRKIRNELKDYTITFDYFDTFNNKNTHSKSLLFLRSGNNA